MGFELAPHTYFVLVFAVAATIFVLWATRSKAFESVRGFRRFMLCAFPVFAWLLALGDLSTELANASYRAHVRKKLTSICDTDYELRINGEVCTHPNAIVNQLINMRGVDANHAGPNEDAAFRLVFSSDAGRVDLDLYPDSRNPSEYWVFAPATDRSVSRISGIPKGLLSN